MGDGRGLLEVEPAGMVGEEGTPAEEEVCSAVAEPVQEMCLAGSKPVAGLVVGQHQEVGEEEQPDPYREERLDEQHHEVEVEEGDQCWEEQLDEHQQGQEERPWHKMVPLL